MKMTGFCLSVFVVLSFFGHSLADNDSLRCFVCSSYMEQCRYTVDASKGYAHRGRCHSKCFVRLSEDGAIDRGCFDGFKDVPFLTSEYEGCRNQTWNGQSLPWCFCSGDLCNQVSMKDLAKLGQGKDHKLGRPSPNDIGYVDKETGKKTSKPEAKEGGRRGDNGYEIVDSQYGGYDETAYNPVPDYNSLYYTGPGYAGYYDYYQIDDPSAYDVRRVGENGGVTYGRAFINSPGHVGGSQQDGAQAAATYQSADTGSYGRDTNYEQKDTRLKPSDSKYSNSREEYSEHDLAHRENTPGDNYNSRPTVNPAPPRYASSEGPYSDEKLYERPYSEDGGPYNRYEFKNYEENDGDKFESNDVPDERESDPYHFPPHLAERIECAKTGFYQNPDDCRTFVACILDAHVRRPYMHLMRCPEGLVWDNRDKICNQYSTTCNVAGEFGEGSIQSKDGTYLSSDEKIREDYEPEIH